MLQARKSVWRHRADASCRAFFTVPRALESHSECLTTPENLNSPSLFSIPDGSGVSRPRSCFGRKGLDFGKPACLLRHTAYLQRMCALQAEVGSSLHPGPDLRPGLAQVQLELVMCQPSFRAVWTRREIAPMRHFRDAAVSILYSVPWPGRVSEISAWCLLKNKTVFQQIHHSG